MLNVESAACSSRGSWAAKRSAGGRAIGSGPVRAPRRPAAATQVLAAGLIVSAAAHAHAMETVVFSQLPTSGTAAGISVTTGGNPFAFADRRLADNFLPTFSFALTGVRWWGGSETSAGDALSNISGFELSLYFDDITTPATPAYDTFVIDLAEIDITPVAGQTVGFLGAQMYQFEADILSSALPGEPLWISIAAILRNPASFTNEAFQWAASTPGDGLIAQDRFDGNGFQQQNLTNTNAAFEVLAVVPGPGALGLVAGAGVVAARRRRA